MSTSRTTTVTAKSTGTPVRLRVAIVFGVVMITTLALINTQAIARAAETLHHGGSPADIAAAFLSADDDEVLGAGDVPGEEDGVIPGDRFVSVFDDLPAVTNLDADLLAAVRAAAQGAFGDGVELGVNSGWRSARLQQHLLTRAIADYGSAAEAARWVASPETSSHVTGQAIDIGGDDARRWLSHHGAAYGLCQIYGNEPWHFELRADAATNGCPEQFRDPSEDPRLQRN